MKPHKAFTLIELLVVIAIIGLLLSVLIPALKKAKEMAAGLVCLSRNAQMVRSWLAYSEDHNVLPDGDTGDTSGWNTPLSGGPRHKCWVAEPQNAAGNPDYSTLENHIQGLRKGSMWPYIEIPEAYNCPNDKRYLKPAVTPPMANALGGYRTYSIGGCISKIWSTTSPANQPGAQLAIATKLSQFVNPSSKIIFVEETDGGGWNGRTWDIRMLTPGSWYDPFAWLHNGNSTFGFADGHSERRKWTDRMAIVKAKYQIKRPGDEDNPNAVIPPIDKAFYKSGPDLPDPKSGDFRWFVRSFVPGQLPSEIQTMLKNLP